MKNFSKGFFFLLFLITTQARASFVVAPLSPYTFDSSSIMWVVTSGYTGNYDSGGGFLKVNATTYSASDLLTIAVTSIPNTTSIIEVVGQISGGTTYWPIPIHLAPNLNSANVTTGTAYGNGAQSDSYYSLNTNGGDTVYFQVNLFEICSVTSQNFNGCNYTPSRSVIESPSTSNFGFNLAVVPITTTSGENISLNSSTGGDSFYIKPDGTSSPTLSTVPSGLNFYYPSDGSILVDPSQFPLTSPDAASTTQTGVVVIAAPTGTLQAAIGTWTNNPIVGRVAPGGGAQNVYGFTNSTNPTAPVYYTIAVAPRDSAGALSDFTLSEVDKVSVASINSFLKKSNCFVATASFRDPEASMVWMLRGFRDHILSRFEYGRSFIGLYYRYGPRAGEWLLNHPWLRVPVLYLLIPVEAVAWLSLHLKIFFLGLLFIFFTLVSGVLKTKFSGRFSWISLFFGVFLISATHPTLTRAESNSPYIDSLKESVNSKGEDSESYSEHLKKKLTPIEKSDSPTSYIDGLKQELPSDSKESYSEELKKTLSPEDSRSAIADFKSGKELKPNKGKEPVHGTIGLRITGAETRNYNAGENQSVSFNQVYGSGWLPQFGIFYEHRPPKSFLGNHFGYLAGLSILYARNTGQFAIPLNVPGYGNVTSSEVKLQFISLPFDIGMTFHTDFLGVMFPYLGAGPSMIGFYETRSDGGESSRGYSFGTWFKAGVGFGLDWMSEKASWEQYRSNGIKHSYFTLEYLYRGSLGGGLVQADSTAIDAGFQFDL